LGNGATLFAGLERAGGFSIRDLQRFGATALIILDRNGPIPSSTAAT